MMNDYQKRCRAIVNHNCGFTPAKQRERLLDIPGPRATRPACQILFQVRIGRSDLPDHFRRLGRKWGAAQIGMNDDTGAINHRLQTGTAQRSEPVVNPLKYYFRRRDRIPVSLRF